MTASYTPGASEKDDVRLLISDIGGQGNEYIFQDEEIAAFLAMRDVNVGLAAATALRTLASNEALVSKRIKFLELETDGPAVAKELRAAADAMEKQANEDGDIEVIEWSVDEFSRRYLRGLT